MTEPRKPARDKYDALVDFAPPRGMPSYIYALVKVTLEKKNGRWNYGAAEPLTGDIRAMKRAPLTSLERSDFIVHKAGADVIIEGDVIAPGGKPTRRMTASFVLNPLRKNVSVFGDRVVEWHDGRGVRFTEPEPFERMPLEWERAYGGVDLYADTPLDVLAAMDGGDLPDHPGLYPRNVLGRGYFVKWLPRPPEDSLLPNFEDPENLLREQSLIPASPDQWWMQPLPWGFGSFGPATFPRSTFLDLETWYPAPLDERLPEIRRGFMLQNLAARAEQNPELYRMFYQEASHGMILPEAVPGTPGAITGMSLDEPDFRFEVPPTPRIDITLDGKKTRVPAKMMSLVLKPNENKLTATYAAIMTDMHRKFVPGMFRDIPLSISVDGDAAVHYEVPPTVADMTAKAQKG